MTRVGDDNWIMAYVHVAHDCQVGNHTVFANNAQLAGHVHVGDYAILGGFTGVHQFCRVGAHSITGVGTVVLQDVPPFVMASDNPARPYGINAEGLKRRGFTGGDDHPAEARVQDALQVRASRSSEAQARARAPGRGMPRGAGHPRFPGGFEARHHPLDAALPGISRVRRHGPPSRSAWSRASLPATCWARISSALARARCRARGSSASAGRRCAPPGMEVLYPAREARRARLRRGDPALPGDRRHPQPARRALPARAAGPLHRRGRAGLQPRPRGAAEGGRRAHRALREPVDLGVARRAHPQDPARGLEDAARVPVRGGHLRARRDTRRLRRPSAGGDARRRSRAARPCASSCGCRARGR